MNTYLFRGTKIKAKSKDTILRRFGLKYSKDNYALITKIKAVKP